MSETLTVDVLAADGKKAGTAELPAELFDVQTNIPLIHQVVVAQLAAARQGTHATKTRAMVSGGGKKPWRQKGTGRARQGSTRAPQFAGGGVVHGPQPRSYAQRTPKKMIAAALRGALSDRAREGKIYVVTNIVDGDVPSTKKALALLAHFGDLHKTLVVIDRNDDLGWLSLRNVAHAHVLVSDQLNAYDVVNSESIIFTEAALQAYVSGPTKGKAGKAVATSTEAEALAAEAPQAEKKAAKPAKVANVVADDAKGVHRGEHKEGFDIKGNEDSMLFHTPQSPFYDATVAEVWFDTIENAKAAGFKAVKSDPGAKEETK